MRNHLWLWRLLFLPAAATLMGASLHKQTSVDPISRLLEVQLHEQKFQINPDAPESQVQKYPDGTLKKITYQQVGAVIVINFHHLPQRDKEQVSKIQRYRIVEGKELLDGPSRTFDTRGNLLTESNWLEGKLHGIQRIFDREHQLRETREFGYGYPIGIWIKFYPDGRKATETRFPQDHETWQTTIVPGGTTTTSLLPKSKFHTPLKGIETWYSPTGHKQKERELRFYVEKGRPIAQFTGISRSFDKKGALIRETAFTQKSGSEIKTYPSEKHELVIKRRYVNGQLFKEEETLRDSPKGEAGEP